MQVIENNEFNITHGESAWNACLCQDRILQALPLVYSFPRGKIDNNNNNNSGNSWDCILQIQDLIFIVTE